MNLSDLKCHDRNPRTIKGEAFTRLCESIKRDPEFMVLRPIIHDNGVILGGNQRYRACKHLGMKEVPDTWVRDASHLSDEQKKRFILVDNAPDGMAGEWDFDMLSADWEVPELLDLGFELPVDIAPAKEITEDEVPEPPADPITNPGDLWLLGDHRLLCGDSTKAEDVKRLMDGKKVDMVLTDPPYGVSYVGKTKDALKVENDELDEASLTKLVCDAFDNAESNCRSGAYWYATVPPGPLHILFADDWKRRGILRQIMVWAKDSMVLGHSEYHYQHEPILFGWIPGERHKNSDRTRTTLWKYDRPKQNREHPTMKPVALWAQAVQDGSRSGEIIYDPFLGSGTTLIAAEQLGRKCYGMEISPQYCDVIVKRWETLTGKKAVLSCL